jgi:hypothetical protein
VIRAGPSDSVMTNDVLQEQWARDLSVRIEVLRHQKLIACADHRAHRWGHRRARHLAAEAVDHFLYEAEQAIRPRPRWPHGRRPLDHWRGITVVKAYESVHAAEMFLVDLLSDDQIRVLLPAVVARAQATLDPGDPLRKDLGSLQEWRTGRKVCRVRFQQAMRAGFRAEDQIYLRIRTFRNLVVKCTVLLVVLMAIMVWLVATHPRSMPLCFAPGTSTVATGSAPTICPSGDHKQPSPDDIMIVAGLGLLGSAAAAAFSIRGIQGIPTPYDIPVALAFFKLPLGAFTAVTGLLLLGGNFVPGLSDLDSQRQILAYALAFGYAQQVVSRLVDDRARMIVSRLPSVAPAAEPPGKPD